MRTIAEMQEKIRETKDTLLDFTSSSLLEFMDYDSAKEFLSEGASEGWPAPEPLTREAVIARMKKYMVFAWGKVENHRGISASRSVDRFGAWIWMLEDEDIFNQYQGTPYQQYGAPKLMFVCESYGFDIPGSNEIRNMTKGRPCRKGCDEGCGL